MVRKAVVFVTGASRGIGLAITKLLLTEFSANVVTLSRSKTPELVSLQEAHSESLMNLQGSVADEAAVKDAVATALSHFKHLDGLILNAGQLEPMGKITSPDIPIDAWKQHFDVNFFSLITAVRAAIPALRASELGGRIVFISSGAATGGTYAWGPYNASKAAMNSLCRTLAQEEPEVTSIALRPGVVDTSMQELLRSAGAAHMTEKDHKRFTTLAAEGKLAKPEESGYVAASLSLKAPKSMSGQFLSWDSEDCKAYRK